LLSNHVSGCILWGRGKCQKVIATGETYESKAVKGWPGVKNKGAVESST